MNSQHGMHLVSFFSEDRLRSFGYDPVLGNTHEALGKYCFNLALAEAFYPPLQLVEVALRNALFNAGQQVHQTAGWLEFELPRNAYSPRQPRVRPSAAQIAYGDIQKALRNLNVPQNPHTPGDLVACLNFGFWVSVLGDAFWATSPSGTSLWPNGIFLVFPNLGRQFGYRRPFSQLVYATATNIRNFRNRIFHHEPVFNSINHPPLQILTQIETMLDWMNCPWNRYLSNQCRPKIESVLNLGYTPFLQDLSAVYP